MDRLAAKHHWMIIVFLACVGAFLTFKQSMLYSSVTRDTFGLLLPWHHVVAGQGYSYNGTPMLHYPPGYGLLAYISFLFVDDFELSGQLVSAGSALLLIPAVFFASKKLFGERTAILAAIFITFAPDTVLKSHFSMPEFLFSLFLFLGFWLHIQILLERPTRSLAVTHGFVTGFVGLIRPEGVVAAILAQLCLMIVWAAPKIRPASWNQLSHRQVARMVVLSFLVFCFIFGPWMLYTRIHVGHWTLSQKSTMILIAAERIEKRLPVSKQGAYNAALKKERPELWKYNHHSSSLSYLFENYKKILVRAKLNFQDIIRTKADVYRFVLSPLLFVFIASLFFGTSAVISLRKWSMRSTWILVSFLIFLSPMAVLLLFFVLNRYIMPYNPFLLLGIALFIDRMLASFPVCHKKVNFAFFSVFFLYLLVPLPGVHLPPPLPYLFKASDLRYKPIEMAGVWLGKNCDDPKSLRILSTGSKRHLFYKIEDQAGFGHQSELKSIHTEGNWSLNEIDVRLRDGFDLLVLDRYVVTNYQSNLLALWNSPDLAETLNWQQVHMDPNGLFQIYRRKASPTRQCGSGLRQG